MAKMITCKTCGKELADTAKSCPHCGAKNRKPIFKKWWFWLLVVVLVVAIAGGNTSDTEGNTGTNSGNQTGSNTVQSTGKTDAFSGDCGITATAEMGTDIIGQPTLTVSVTNTTEKEISAIKYYVVPLDVYGEEVKGVFAQNQFYTDDAIAAGKSTKDTFQFLDNQVKTVKLYVYSVYFEDGTQWGNKDATKSVILKSGMQIEVSGKSEK